jgi:Tol biopolymer transport system component
LAGQDFQEGNPLGIRAHGFFCWSTDGANLAFSVFKDRKTRTVEHGVINVKTKEQKELLLPAGHLVSDWSPDGQWFLTGKTDKKTDQEDIHHVYLVKRDGSGIRRLDESKGRAGFPRFSPDGHKVLFIGWEDHKPTDRPSRVYVADLPAGKARPVSPELNAYVEAACWSPDGKHIAYRWARLTADPKFEDQTEHILSVVEADGSNSATLRTDQDRLGEYVNDLIEWRPASATFIEGFQNAPKPADSPKTAAKPPTKADGIVFLLNEELAMIQPNGQGFTPLPRKAKHIFGFQVSPDGKRLAYTAVSKGKLNTYVTDLFSESSIIAGISRLTGDDLPDGEVLEGEADYCLWSADGTKLACGAGDVRKGTRQWIVDLKTGAKTELKFPEGHWLQDWSRDGEWFLTCKQDKPAEDKFTPQVYLVKKNGSEVRRLSNDKQAGWPARFSPDGRRALFVAWDAAKSGPHSSRVHVVDLPDGKPRPVSPELNAVVYSACWSPDGKRIAYIWHQVRPNFDSDDPVEYVLSVIDADGKNPVTVKTEKGRLGPPVHVDWR